jgi:hypothetical protein
MAGIIDIKSGSDSPDIDLQIAAYDELYRNGLPIASFDADTHTYRDDEGGVIPSVTRILKDAELTPALYKTLDPWYAEKGHAVHAATEYFDRGTLDPDSVDPQIKGYLDAYRQFRKDLPLDILSIELRLRHPRYRYSGTIDRVVEGNRHYKLFLKSNGKYKLVEVKNIKTHLTYFLSALIVTTGHTGAGLDIATSNLGTWKKRFLKEE